MSWQSQWGTVKATNAKACALYYEIANVGKTIESSKKRVIWRLKVEEGREFEISLTHSLASGKKVLRVDSIVKYTSQSLSFGDWDYVFNLPGGHCVHIIIKPSVELNDMYDLIIDGVSFRRLPERLDPNRVKAASGNAGVTNVSSTSRKANSTFSYSNGNYSKGSGGGSRESSFGPWECPRCTLVNEKPLAPICEACGGPKPDYISPEARTRAKTVAAENRSPALSTSTSRLPSKSAAPPPSGDFFSSSFAATTAADINTNKGFDAFDAQPVATRKKSEQDISSMLAGLDFTPTAPPTTEVAPPEFAAPTGASQLEDGNSDPRTNSSDLWDSNIVDLNLRPEDKKLQSRPAKSYQTLEQARLQAPKEKVAVLPPPPPQAAMPMATMPAVAPMGYYATPSQVAQAGYYNGGQQMYATTAGMPGYGGMVVQPQQAYGGYPTGGAMGAPNAYQFMTAAPPAGGVGQRPPTMMASDPFATLS